ncbi:unnamed protein product [Oppiella nova]|uniref:Uncharacterized protein n=1 Tax=Oppiella nova TaxID=334625 RepID=A0A7R9QEC0_9ACAR|nr:unnamed protein product [Oppiella nova]CAG2164100.1 unnamed protein product [Oppiella nova]
MGDNLGFRNYVYLLWVVSVTPVVHILQNDLTAQMVNRDVMNADTIDDLFDDRLEVYRRIIDGSGKCGDGLHNYWSPTDMDIQGAYPYYYNPVNNPTASVNFLKVYP